MNPILKGTVTFGESGSLVWEGVWGMTSQAFEDQTQVHKFRYVCKKHRSLITGDLLSFKGFFEVISVNKIKNQFTEKKLEMEMLEDDGDIRKVKGSGANKFGNFVIIGQYQPQSRMLEVTRSYSPTVKKPRAKKLAPSPLVAAHPANTDVVSSPLSPADLEIPLDDSYLPDAQDVLKELKSRDSNRWFSHPVDAKALGLKGYYGVVKTPMDLGTIQMKMNLKKYCSLEECIDDMRLTFVNALMFNPRGSPVYRAAADMSVFLEDRAKALGQSANVSIGKRARIPKKFYDGEEVEEGDMKGDYIVEPVRKGRPPLSAKSKYHMKKKGKLEQHVTVPKVRNEPDQGFESFDELESLPDDSFVVMTPPPESPTEMVEPEPLDLDICSSPVPMAEDLD
jgi:hypothetical protein